ncbi:HIT domain-containing protein [Geotalea sp. SG265]|uniref:HIT family protein n=1 Tax=Geotalea sp. SG265 TaxID=2922867 RepID=UPI001FAEA514|nr:HIT domain-containing protein [Geotalea sp. SG265]
MERLWAPWRMEYIENSKSEGCVLCIGPDRTADRDRLILYRSELSLVMLNRYPYTNGHLMVAPLRHTSDMDSLDDKEMLDLFRVLKLCRSVVEKTAFPHGFNVGINLGHAAGAGIDDHLHIHLVPRWNGDTNFMTVISDVRVMPENLLTTYDRLLPMFAAAGKVD